jgi:PAS domain S-box-containing protein
MLEDRLTILLIEDNPAHARLIKEMCLDCETVDMDLQWETCIALGLARLRKGGVIGVLLDLNLPDSQGIETLTRVDSEFPEIPIIVLTGQEDEAMAVEAVKRGAQDYLIKGVVDRNQLVRSIRYAIERKRMAVDLTGARDDLEKRVEERTSELLKTNERLKQEIAERNQAENALRRSEERFRAMFDAAQDMIFMMDSHLRYEQVNPATTRMLGLDESEIIGRKSKDIYGAGVGQQLRLLDLRVLEGETIEREHAVHIKGVKLILNTILRPLHNAEGKIVGVFGISRDVTDRARTLPVPKAFFESYSSQAMNNTMSEARSAAASDGTVLLQGESGSGKDYLARWIHDHSKRALGPYFSLNCATVARELAESELFGHERGAFTGAHGRKRGLLELAEGGTLLLNEIGELPLSLQSKLLTFLDTRSFLRVGGEKHHTVNARIISATNRSLDKEVEEGRFLSALFYRINVFGINLPPLRDRIEDLPALLEELMSRLARELQITQLPYIDPADVRALKRYNWPGNVRELRNTLERALMLSDGTILKLGPPSVEAGPHDWSHVSCFPVHERTLHDVTDEVIKSMCLEALRRCEGNKRCAARTLGIARDSLYRHMKRFGIESENQTKDELD